MDRNRYLSEWITFFPGVALRKESVDRNGFYDLFTTHYFASLSARRAWIEIGTAWVQEFPKLVALRKESVDRNSYL